MHLIISLVTERRDERAGAKGGHAEGLAIPGLALRWQL